MNLAVAPLQQAWRGTLGIQRVGGGHLEAATCILADTREHDLAVLRALLTRSPQFFGCHLNLSLPPLTATNLRQRDERERRALGGDATAQAVAERVTTDEIIRQVDALGLPDAHVRDFSWGNQFPLSGTFFVQIKANGGGYRIP